MRIKALGALALAASIAGCTGGAPRPEEGRAPQALTAAVPPEQVVASPRQLRVAGSLMGYDELMAHLPGRLTVAEAADALVEIPPAMIDDRAERSTAAVDAGAPRVFQRGFPPDFREQASRFRYYPYRDYYFPYFQVGETFYPLTERYRSLFDASGAKGLFAGYTPFFYRYGSYFYPYHVAVAQPDKRPVAPKGG